MAVLVLALLAVLALIEVVLGLPCHEGCGACVAAPGATVSNGIRDIDCERCRTGYRWWPCGEATRELCLCSILSAIQPTVPPPALTSDPQPRAELLAPVTPPTRVGTGGWTYPPASNWEACGGKNHACGQDAACAECANPRFHCVSDNNPWYYQCRPRPGIPSRSNPSPRTQQQRQVAPAPEPPQQQVLGFSSLFPFPIPSC